MRTTKLESENDGDEIALLALMPDPRPLPEELAEQHELQNYLQRAIERLSQKNRSVVLLRYTAQLSFSEIGRALGIPEATAKTYFYRAKLLLRASLAL